MWKVLFSSRSEEMIIGYIDLYRDYFLEIFTDTGIWSEELIQAQYIQIADNLQTNIRETVVSGLSRDIVWYTVIDSEIKSTVFHTGKRNIIVEYSEDLDKHIRYVWLIRIYRQK